MTHSIFVFMKADKWKSEASDAFLKIQEDQPLEMKVCTHCIGSQIGS